MAMRASLVARSAAAAIVGESPRITIAKNVLRFRELKAATNEAALEAASKSSPQIDLEALPAEIQGLKGYLSSAPAAAGAVYKKDPAAWQNMSFANYIGVEAARDNTWPFVAGGMCVFLRAVQLSSFSLFGNHSDPFLPPPTPHPPTLLSVTFVLLGMGIPALLPKEGKKNSKYISMIEGRHGKPAHDDHGHGHAH